MNRTELIQLSAGPLPPFKSFLRKAIRRDLKTMTRRVIKIVFDGIENPGCILPARESGWIAWYRENTNGLAELTKKAYAKGFECPYGKVGQIRYLREPLFKDDKGLIRYTDDKNLVWAQSGKYMVPWRWQRDALPQIFMPKEFARTFVEIQKIRVERVQEISNNGALAEGTPDLRTIENNWDLRRCFQELWNSINFKRGFGWDVNPWVWVIEFKRGGLNANENQD